VKQYSDISVTFRHGHHPELHIYDDENSLVEKVDLTKVGNDMDAIRLLFEEKGFTPMPDAVGDAIGETAAPTKDEV